MKNNKGITLIALVITIIVLLILAGVAIAMLSGENGILTRASDSKVANEIGAKKDEVNMAAAEAITEYYEDKYVTELTGANLKDIQTKITEKVTAGTTGDIKIEYKDAADAAHGVTDTDLNGGKNKVVIVSSVSKEKIYSKGVIDSEGKITWTDNFKTTAD